MKTLPILLAGTAGVAVLLTACKKSDSTAEQGKRAMPETQKALGTAADETKKNLSQAASTVAESAKSTVSDLTSKFAAMAKTQSDSVLAAIGQDLGAKAKSLVDACGGNESVKTNVEASLVSLQSGKDTQALAPAFQAAQGPGLTDGQKQIAKEFGNLASAFVVQRNFSSLQGSQGDVASLVNSLRGGQYSATLAPLKNIMNNASLTDSQKQILGSLTDQYAPALKQAAGSLQQTLKGLGGLGTGNK